MKRVLLPVFLICAALGSARSEPSQAERKELARLIDEIPSPGDLRLVYDTIRNKESPPHTIVDAQSKVAKAKESVLKLRKLLKVGTNIFDYPGLITKAHPSYYTNFLTGGQYTLHISVGSGGEGVISPYEFGLHLDDKGQITELYDIVYK
jgi:hypothetical protein